jgi:hypothetical protein
MAKTQINIRISAEGLELLGSLIRHFDARHAEAGRHATQAEVIERALRCLAEREKLLKKSARARASV